MRRCVKTTCSEAAAATVLLRYGERVAWLRELLPERDPNFLELCADHADRMTVPVGWTRVDERSSPASEPGAAAPPGGHSPGPAPAEEPTADPVPAALLALG